MDESYIGEEFQDWKAGGEKGDGEGVGVIWNMFWYGSSVSNINIVRDLFKYFIRVIVC